MNDKINHIDKEMNKKINDAVNEYMFKHLEQSYFMNMINQRFENVHAKIDSMIGLPRMFKTLIDMDDDGKGDEKTKENGHMIEHNLIEDFIEKEKVIKMMVMIVMMFIEMLKKEIAEATERINRLETKRGIEDTMTEDEMIIEQFKLGSSISPSTRRFAGGSTTR